MAHEPLDFGAFDPGDWRWWLRLKWRIDALTTEQAVRVLEFQHRHAVAALPFMEPEAASQRWSAAGELVDAAARLLTPWLPSAGKRPGRDTAELERNWSIGFGDRNDPETQARIAKTLAWLKKREDYLYKRPAGPPQTRPKSDGVARKGKKRSSRRG